jgi:hypothetical protein
MNQLNTGASPIYRPRAVVMHGGFRRMLSLSSREARLERWSAAATGMQEATLLLESDCCKDDFIPHENGVVPMTRNAHACKSCRSTASSGDFNDRTRAGRSNLGPSHGNRSQSKDRGSNTGHSNCRDRGMDTARDSRRPRVGLPCSLVCHPRNPPG